MSLRIAHSLDLRGLPGHAVAARLHQVLDKTEPGALVEIIASDRGALTDIVPWCEMTGVDLLESSQLGLVFRFVFRKHADG